MVVLKEKSVGFIHWEPRECTFFFSHTKFKTLIWNPKLFRNAFWMIISAVKACVYFLRATDITMHHKWSLGKDITHSRPLLGNISWWYCNSWFPPNDSLMLSPLVMRRLGWFPPGTQRMPLKRREWTCHHKSNGDSWATDHRGQSRGHRKCIPSPHSHCPHWCLFKLGSDTWRDYFSTQISSHSTLASNTPKVRLSAL